jgi:hypothetical protein
LEGQIHRCQYCVDDANVVIARAAASSLPMHGRYDFDVLVCRMAEICTNGEDSNFTHARIYYDMLK